MFVSYEALAASVVSIASNSGFLIELSLSLFLPSFIVTEISRPRSLLDCFRCITQKQHLIKP